MAKNTLNLTPAEHSAASWFGVAILHQFKMKGDVDKLTPEEIINRIRLKDPTYQHKLVVLPIEEKPSSVEIIPGMHDKDLSLVPVRSDSEDLVVSKRLLMLENSAHQRRLEFNLTFVEVRRLLRQKKCYYTGIKFEENGTPNGLTFDRVDNSKGYIIGNVVVCTKEFNNVKGALSLQQMEFLAKGLQKPVKKKMVAKIVKLQVVAK